MDHDRKADKDEQLLEALLDVGDKRAVAPNRCVAIVAENLKLEQQLVVSVVFVYSHGDITSFFTSP